MHVTSLDGVISSPEKWSSRYWDDEHDTHTRNLVFAADALVLRRATHEGFAEYWPTDTDGAT